MNASNSAVNTYSTIEKSSLLFLNQVLKGEDKFKEYHSELEKAPHITRAPFTWIATSTDDTFLNGVVRDKATNQPLPFVNVGLMHHEVGTVTNESGSFALPLAKNHGKDSARVSMVGFKAQVFKASELLKRKGVIEIKLEQSLETPQTIYFNPQSSVRKGATGRPS
ncbi:MAG: carboxypeptidase-like regulatory domain-containing protein [Bacteroidota bacterium]